MKTPVVVILLIVLATAGGLFYFTKQTSTTPSKPEQTEIISPVKTAGSDIMVDKQASFAIFTNGTFREFSNSMYHNLSENALIESTNPNAVHVKKQGVTWNDFFQTLPFKLSKDCLTTGIGQTFCTGQNGTLKFYLNEQPDSGALDKIINQGDKLLISFGTDGEAQITSQLERIPNP